MILLDTNVISEPARPKPAEAVLRWFDEFESAGFCLSSVTEAELRRGIATMPEGKAKREKLALLINVLEVDFAGLILPFESKSAFFYAEIFAHHKIIGRPISVLDCMIAAIARANGCKLATRNVADFGQCGVEIVNPWARA